MVNRKAFSLSRGAAAITIAMCVVTPTLAAESSWKMSEMKKNNGEAWGAALMSKTSNGQDIGFRCSDGKLLFAAALEPADIEAAFNKAGPQTGIEVTYTVADEEPSSGKWIYLRRHKVIASSDQKTSRRLYNAAVRGESVLIEAKRRGGGEYNMPAPDKKTFADFMEACNFNTKQS
ncbi:MAG: hypothetical protein AAGD92_12925 [Pseudomonadota bacterium]